MEKTFMERKMEKVGPDQKQEFKGCERNVGVGGPASAGGEERQRLWGEVER